MKSIDQFKRNQILIEEQLKTEGVKFTKELAIYGTTFRASGRRRRISIACRVTGDVSLNSSLFSHSTKEPKLFTLAIKRLIEG